MSVELARSTEGPTLSGVLLLASPPVGAASTEPVTWVDIAPIVIAGLALVLSVVMGTLNRSTAKKALRLSERQEGRRASRIDVYVNEQVSWSLKSGRLAGVNVVVTNPTDGTTSLVGAELHLTYEVGSSLTTVRVPASPGAVPSSLAPQVVSLELPLRLDANAAKSGWLVFALPEGLTGGHPIERYDLVTKDVQGKEASVQLGFFRDGGNGEAAQDER